MNTFRPLLTVIFISLSMPAMAVDVYRWTDESGTVNYSLTPPAHQDGQPGPAAADTHHIKPGVGIRKPVDSAGMPLDEVMLRGDGSALQSALAGYWHGVEDGVELQVRLSVDGAAVLREQHDGGPAIVWRGTWRREDGQVQLRFSRDNFGERNHRHFSLVEITPPQLVLRAEAHYGFDLINLQRQAAVDDTFKLAM